MTRLLLVTTLLLAGCASPTAPSPGALVSQAAPMPAPDAPLDIQGTYWMPTVVGADAGHGNVSFRVNASGEPVTIRLHVGMKQMGVNAPATPAMVVARLVDASNRTIATAMISPPDADATMATTNASVGRARLDFDTHGGSDGSGNGDFVEYAITMPARQG